MGKGRGVTFAVGLMFMLVGLFLLAAQYVPGLRGWSHPGFGLPFVVVAVAVLFLLLGLATSTPAMLVPACIFGGIGGLLLWQNQYGRWDTWAYAWALIPGFVGVGLFLLSLVSSKERRSIGAGLWMMFISAVMFLVFGTLFGAFRGPWRQLLAYWPLLLIAAGLLTLLEVVFRRRR